MNSWYHELLENNTIRNLLYFNNKIKKDASVEIVEDEFHKWLSVNKEFREEVGKFNEEQVKEFKATLKEIAFKRKNEDDTFFPFNSIKIISRRIKEKHDRKEDLKNTSILDQINNVEIPKLTPLSFSNFMARNDKKKYLIKNMIATGTINMIYSPPACMKSFISYYMSMCLVSGRSFLYQKVKRCNVGYFDWENPISDIQNRIQGMCNGMGFKPEDLENLYFFTKQPTFLNVDKFEVSVYSYLRDELLEFIKVHDLKVLFFDTFRRLGNFDENDSKVINAIKSELFDPIIAKTNCCIIFLHHTSKSGENYRGSVDIEGILDTAYSVTKKEKTQELTLKNTKRRNNELEKINIQYEITTESLEDEDGDMYDEIQTVEFIKVAEKQEAQENDYAQIRNLMISKLDVSIKYKNKDIVDIITTETQKSIPTAKRIINWLVNKEILLKTGTGHSTRYQIHPELKYTIEHEASGDQTSKVIEQYIHELFKENDLIEIKDLKKSENYGKGKFDEKYLSIIINEWLKKGWINPAKEGYLMVTELYRGEIKNV